MLRSTIIALIALVVSVVSVQAEKVYPINSQGYAIIELEDLNYSNNWKKESTHQGYNGSGYLVWDGDPQSCEVLNKPMHEDGHDITGQCQGSDNDKLIFSVKISTPGYYEVNVRNWHKNCDGSNDCWISSMREDIRTAANINDENKIYYRVTDNYPLAQWGWSESKMYLYSRYDIPSAGIYQFYVAGRSTGFAVDRVYVSTVKTPNIQITGMSCETKETKTSWRIGLPDGVWDNPTIAATTPIDDSTPIANNIGKHNKINAITKFSNGKINISNVMAGSKVSAFSLTGVSLPVKNSGAEFSVETRGNKIVIISYTQPDGVSGQMRVNTIR